MNFPKILIELYCEELPANQIAQTLKEWKLQWYKRLEERGLIELQLEAFATPNRFILIVEKASLNPHAQYKYGPSKKAALLSDGQTWSPAAKAWAEHEAISFSCTEWMKKGQHEVLAFKMPFNFEAFKAELPRLIEETLLNLALKKSLYWSREAPHAKFLRPIRNVMIFVDAIALEGKVFDVTLQRSTYIDAPFNLKRLEIKGAESYRVQLREHGIEVDAERRAQTILHEIERIEAQNGCVIQSNAKLLEEVVYLSERPYALMGNFDPKYLELPSHLIEYTLNHHQKAFSVRELKSQSLQPCFMVVVQSLKKSSLIQTGYESVVKARLEDALFFYQNDLALSFNAPLERLKSLKIHDKLGSFEKKMQRVQALFQHFFRTSEEELDLALRAIALSKNDLISQVVVEIPELAGIMGAHYAQRAHQPPKVCSMIEQHYLPKQLEDPLPATSSAARFALLDKLDFVVGLIGMGFAPTASADPFAIRRNSLGVLRLLLSNALDSPELNLSELVQAAAAHYNLEGFSEFVLSDTLEFFRQRLKVLLQKEKSDFKIVQAFLAQGEWRLAHLAKQIETFSAAWIASKAHSIPQIEKRARQLLKSQGVEGDELFEYAYDYAQLKAHHLPPEIQATEALAPLFLELSALIDPTQLSLQEYEAYWTRLSQFSENLSLFLDQVHISSASAERKALYFGLLSSSLIAFNNLLDCSLL